MTLTTHKGPQDMTASELRTKLADAETHCRRLEDDLETLAWKARQYDWVHGHLLVVREFIADVQRGLRSLSEYDAVCTPWRWENECPAPRPSMVVRGADGPANEH